MSNTSNLSNKIIKATKTQKTVKSPRTYKQALERAKRAFHSFIRERDRELPCISCGTSVASVFHAGHYMSSGNYPIHRFNERNVHKQCQRCNYFKSGNLLEYRKGLILKIGVEWVEKLENGESKWTYTIEDLDIIHDAYKEKLRELKIVEK